MLDYITTFISELFHIESTITLLILSWSCGIIGFLFTFSFVSLLIKGELQRIRRMLVTLRILIIFLLLLQLPLFYMAVSLDPPVEKQILVYGKERKSWLFYLGRPCLSTMGLLFGFFSDISVYFRNMCLLILLSLLIQDSLSSMLLTDRLECLENLKCNQRSVWNIDLYSIYIYRDLIELTLTTWSLLCEGYMMIYIGLWPPYYYNFRQLSVGDMNPMHRLRKDYQQFHNEYTYYDEEDGICISNVSLQMANTKNNKRLLKNREKDI